MLLMTFVLLLSEWTWGVLTSHTLGGLIDVLLAIALVVVLIGIRQGRRWARREEAALYRHR